MRISGTILLAFVCAAPRLLLADGGAMHQAAQSTPVRLGTSGGNVKDVSRAFCCSGTLGALVVRGGTQYVLSNNHVLGRSGQAALGEDVTQPGLIDNGCRPKTIVADFSEAPTLGGGSNVDAALAAVRSGAVDGTGAILDIGVPASTPAVPTINAVVAKSGRTTGLTCGPIGSVSTDVSVQYQRGCNAGKKFTVSFADQVVVNSSSFSAGGDSGSLIVTADGARPVALLFAGSSTTTIANPIQDVIAALGVSFVGGGSHAVACPGVAAGATSRGTTSTAGLMAQGALEHAMTVKNAHAPSLLSRRGVQGVGVGASDDDPSQPAIVIYVVQGMRQAPLPDEVGGVPTKVVRTDRFRAFGWNEAGDGTCGQ